MLSGSKDVYLFLLYFVYMSGDYFISKCTGLTIALFLSGITVNAQTDKEVFQFTGNRQRILGATKNLLSCDLLVRF